MRPPRFASARLDRAADDTGAARENAGRSPRRVNTTAKKLSPAQIAAGFGGKRKSSGGKRRASSGRRTNSRKSSKRSFTVHALDIAAAGVMLGALNAPAIAARALGAATGQVKVQDAALGAVSDIYAGAKKNWVILAAVPLGLAAYRSAVPSKTLKVPGVPVRVGA